MSERQRIAFLVGCMFVIGLHLKTAGHMLLDGWRGPYADAPVVERQNQRHEIADERDLRDGRSVAKSETVRAR